MNMPSKNMMNLTFLRKNIEIISYITTAIGTLIGVLLLFFGITSYNYNMMLSGALVIWCTQIIFCFFNIKQRFVLLIFNLTIFLFLLSRVTVAAFRGESWWYNYSVDANICALILISLSIIFISIGALLFEKLIKCKKNSSASPKNKRFCLDRESLVLIVRLGLAICMICFFIREADKLLFMSGKEYASYYTEYKCNLPFLIQFPAGCMKYFLCMFLALKPSKIESFIWLGINVVSTLPMLKIGARGNFILSIIFAFVYYCLRSISGKNWFGKLEKIAIIVCIPLMIISMGAYNYTRDDKEVKISAGELVVDFLYKQGTTYDTVLQGYTYQDKLPGKDSKNYTFSAVTDTVLYNSLGKRIFNAPEITDGNSLRTAYRSHSFSHAISYVVLGDEYIGGKGRGSSYIIENYIDFGYTGCIVFSLLLGVVCSASVLLFGKKWFGSVIILNILLDLFFTPRAESLSSVTFLFSYKFWFITLAVVITSMIAKIIIEKLNLKKITVFKWMMKI